jgi:hypothetical protein
MNRNSSGPWSVVKPNFPIPIHHDLEASQLMPPPQRPGFDALGWTKTPTYSIIKNMRVLFLRGLASLVLVAGAAAQNPPAEELGKPLDWPVLVAKTSGIQVALRTAWRDGALKYVVKISDEKGRVARYLSKPRGQGRASVASFQIKFYDEDGFILYTLYLSDSSLSKTGDTPSFESVGESPCAERLYQALAKSWKAVVSSTSEVSTHGITYPTELDEPIPPAKR